MEAITAPMKTRPLVSVIMSVFNGEKYLKESVESILCQTYEDFEFIIINDGSTDSSDEIIGRIKDTRIKYIKHENYGVAKSINNAIPEVKGKYIARFDSDDISYPERLEKEVAFLEENKNCVIVGSNADIIDKDGVYLYTSKMPVKNSEIKETVAKLAPFFQSSVMFHTGTFIECGGYFEKVRQYGEDFILWNKLAKYGDLYNIEEPLIKYRLAPSATTNRNKKTTQKIISIANKVILTNNISGKDESFIKNIGKIPQHKKLSSYHCNIGCLYLYKNGNRHKAREQFRKSFNAEHYNAHALFFFALSFMPLKIIELWKKMRNIE